MQNFYVQYFLGGAKKYEKSKRIQELSSKINRHVFYAKHTVSNEKSAHLTIAERCTLINLWLTAIFSLFDGVTANRHMNDNSAMQQKNDLNNYRHERSWHDLIISLLPAHLCAFQGGSCSVKPIAVLHLTVDGCTLHVDYTYSYKPTTTIGSSCLEEMWRDM